MRIKDVLRISVPYLLLSGFLYAAVKPTKKAQAGAAGVTTTARGASAARSRAGKKRAVRRPPAPSYQLHPDTGRYAEIQKALADRGYYKGDPNGEWNDQSADALRRFQADQKLPDDGRITALSLSALGLGPHHDGAAAAGSSAPAPHPETPPIN